MKTVTVKDKCFGVSIPEDVIKQRVKALAERISKDMDGKNPLFLAVLNGAFVFAADLMRELTIPFEISFVKLASYQGTTSTGKVKEVSRQISENPFVEICAFMNGTWLRISAELVEDDNHDIKVAMLEKMPSLKGMYSADDDNMQMFYLKDATATFSSFTAEPEVITF